MSGIVIAKNAVYNIVAFVVTITVTFLLVPVMLFYLGPVGFGVWAIARVFVSYASLSDFGLSSTITKFVAELEPRREFERLARVLQSAFILYTLISVLLLALVWLFDSVLIAAFFADSGEFAADVRFILLGSMVVFAFSLVGTVFSAAINGLQKMQITNSITIVYWLFNGMLMYGALVMGFGLRGIVYANAIATVVSVGLLAFVFFRLFSNLPLTSFRLHPRDIRESLRFSKDIFVIAIANSVHLHYDKLLLSSFVSLNSVSNYEVASRVIQAMRQIVVLLLNPILPVASELHAQQRDDSVTKLYYRSLKYLVFFCIPFFSCVGFFADSLITLWLGPHQEVAIITLQLLLVANALNLLTGPAYFISIGVGKARFGMYSSAVGLLLNGILSFLLLRNFGYTGLLVGTSAALSIEALLFLRMIHRELKVEWYAVLRLFPQPLLAMALGIALGLGAGTIVNPLFAKIAVMVLVSLGVYLTFMLKPGYFDARDREYLREIKGKMLEKFALAGQ